MKKLISSLFAIVVAASASAQSHVDADSLKLMNHIDQQVRPLMQKAGAGQVTVNKTIDFGASGNGAPAPAPKKAATKGSNSGGGPATASVAAPQKGKTTKINGKEYFVTPYGLLVPGQTLFDENGDELVVDDYGNMFKTGRTKQQQAPAPNPNNNTGTGTAGVTVVNKPYDVLPDGRIVVMDPNVRVIQADGSSGGAGGSAAAASAGASGGQDPLMVKTLGPNDFVYDRAGNKIRETTKIKAMEVRRGYDEDGNPTPSTEAFMANKGGFWRALGSSIVVGGGCGNCGPTYNTTAYVDNSCNTCGAIYAQPYGNGGYCTTCH